MKLISLVRILLAVTLLALACGGLWADEAKKLLRWKFAPGDRFAMRIVQDTKSETVVNQKKIAVGMQMAIELDWRVQAVADDGAATMAQAFTRLSLRSKLPDGREVGFDTKPSDAAPSESPKSNSKKPSPEIVEAEARAAALRPLLRARCEVVMDPRGEIIAVRLPAETDSLLRGTESLDQLKQLLTKDGLARTLRQSLGSLPEAAVGVNDSWLKTTEIDSPQGKIRMTNRFAFAGLSRADEVPHRDPSDPPTDKITMSAEIAVAGREAGAFEPPQQPIQLAGEYFFDAAGGRLVASTLTQSQSASTTLLDTQIQVQTTSSVQTHVRRFATGDADSSR